MTTQSIANVRIERNVPLPSMAPSPFDDMLVGDSFLVSSELRENVRLQIDNRNRRKDGPRFVYRTLPGGEVRCWRKS